MDRFNPDTSNETPKIVEEQTPHSGIHYDEKPVKDFDKTKLAEAVDQGLITVPEDVSPLIETNQNIPPIVPPTHTTEQGSAKPERKKFGMGAKITVGLAGLALAGGAALGITNVVNAGNNTPPEKDPDGTSQIDEEPGNNVEEEPGTSIPEAINDPIVTPENRESLLSELIIPSDTPKEQIPEKFTEIQNRWMMAGAVPETVYNFDYTVEVEEYARGIAQANAEVYAVATFGEDYANASDPSVQNLLENMIQANTGNIIRYIKSYGDENKENVTPDINKETWQAGQTVVEAVATQETSDYITFELSREIHDNGANNMYADMSDDGVINTISASFAVHNGNYVFIGGRSLN